jgi:ribonuclease HI
MAVITEVTIYTDGACSGNPGPGGWASILMAGGVKKELSGGEKDTTNNRMELMAVIEGLRALKRPCKVDIYSDSAYVVNAFSQNWIDKWVRNGWKNSAKAEVANSDLWKELIDLTSKHNVTFHKVKGHADNEYNNRCDELAVAEWKKISEEKNRG